MRLVETTGIPATYRAHEEVPADFELRDGAAARAIVGGREATLDEIPGAVLVLSMFTDEVGRTGWAQCTGTLTTDLGPRHVLTAAHCCEEATGLFDRFDVFYGAGSGGASKGTMRRLSSARCYVSPDYDPAVGVSGGGDIAVIELIEPADLAPHEMARLATLDEMRGVAEGDPVIVAGWGSTKGGPTGGVDPSPVLKMAQVAVRRPGLADLVVGDVTGRVQGACQGDSGGSSRKGTDRRIVTGALSKTFIEGGGSCVQNGYRQVYTAAPLIRLTLGLVE